MSILNHLAQAAAVLLIMELLVVLLLFAGIAGGLAFGLHWARGKTEWAGNKAEAGLSTAARYVDKGTTMAAQPMIVAHGWFATAQGTLLAIQQEARRLRRETATTAKVPVATPAGSVNPPPAAPPTVAVPVSPEAAAVTAVQPVTEDTTTFPAVDATQPFRSGAVPVARESRQL